MLTSFGARLVRGYWVLCLRRFRLARCGRCLAVGAMLTYTSAELRTLAAYNRPPPRAVRKTLFRFRLWRPAGQRVSVRSRSRPRAPAATVNNATGRSADSPSSTAVSIGWLNAQSLRKKVDAISMLELLNGRLT